jgi:hypothetical protein
MLANAEATLLVELGIAQTPASEKVYGKCKTCVQSELTLFLNL